MEIKNKTIMDPNIGQVETKKTAKTGTSPQTVSKNGKDDYAVDLSTRAKELNANYDKAYSIAKNTSPIRQDKVDDIKKRIAEGTYKVDSENIADGIMREAIREHLATTER